MGANSSVLSPQRRPEFQLVRAEAERPRWAVKSVACFVLVLLHAQYGIYDVLTQKFGANPSASGENVNPLLFSCLRDVVGFPVLMTIASIMDMREVRLVPRRLHAKEVPAFLLMAFFLYGNQGFNVLGLYLADAPTAAFFQQLIPILSFVLSVSFGQEPLPSIKSRDGFPKYIGIVSATVGAIGLVFAGHKSGEGEPVSESHLRRALGEISLFLNTLCTSLYFVMQSRLVFSSPAPDKEQQQLRGLERGVLHRWSTTPLLTAAYTYLFSAVFSTTSFGVEVLYLRYHQPNSWKKVLHVPWPYGWIPILYAALIASTVAYAGLSWTNKLLNPSVTLGVIALQPVSTAILSVLFLPGTRLTGQQLASGCLVILGIISQLASRQYRHEEEEGGTGAEDMDLERPPLKRDTGIQTDLTMQDIGEN